MTFPRPIGLRYLPPQIRGQASVVVLRWIGTLVCVVGGLALVLAYLPLLFLHDISRLDMSEEALGEHGARCSRRDAGEPALECGVGEGPGQGAVRSRLNCAVWSTIMIATDVGVVSIVGPV